jgi:Kef-type K+ transport system membrane component KefB
MPWLKKELGYLKNSFSQILIGILLVGLTISGLGLAIFLRFAGFNGTIISFAGITIEVISIIIIYLVLRRYIIPKEEGSDKSIQKAKTKLK